MLVVSSAVALTHMGTGTASPAASAGPTGVLPSSPVSTPPQKVDEALARSLVGTFDVTAVVTKGNGSLTVGMKNRYVMKLKLDCSSPTRCTVESSNRAATFSGLSLSWRETRIQPCPDDGGGAVHRPLRDPPGTARWLGHVALVGTQLLEAIDVSECQHVTQKPVRYSLVAVRR